MQDFTDYIKGRLRETRIFNELVATLLDKNAIEMKGALGSLKSIVIALLFGKLDVPILFITHNENIAEHVKEDLALLVNNESVVFFPPSDYFPHRKIFSDNLVRSYRMDTLEKLAENRKLLITTSAKGIARRVPSIQELSRQRISIQKGKSYKFDELITRLVEIGFERQPVVDRMGELSVRGGIIDIFPFSKENPIRIEFWGDQVESIREFDLENQRSIKEIETALIFPIEKEEINGKNASPSSENGACFVDLLPSNALVIFDEPTLIAQEMDNYLIEMEKLYHLGETQIDLENDRKSPNFNWHEIESRLNGFKKIYSVSVKSNALPCITFSSIEQTPLQGNLKLLKEAVENFFEKRKNVIKEPIFFLCDYPDQGARMVDVFDDLGLDEKRIKVEICSLFEGFENRDANLILFTDHQFYGRQRKLRLKKKFTKGLNLNQLKMLHTGDFVVHEDYGIGIYQGLKKIKIGKNERECIQIKYQNNDVVYVPLDRMTRVQKYSAKEGVAPQINKLGGADWEKLKARTKKKIKDIAKDLIEIYAARKALKGHSFPNDTLWQKELEAAFPYEDTPDQITATRAIKKDMESPRPMDRLICGDVGFGKTELAIRAAFKSVNDNRQVAVLVPTTILAEQHYRTFRSRLSQFPVKVEVLSRFRSKTEQALIACGIEHGKVDIVIGTHRLLSKDIKFNNLGLLVVDEEQRFGVKQKEKLKERHKTVDVLTLTATPIPRTLHLSLMGARDMSNINTPPKDRLPVVTEVAMFDQELIREAILREIQRGGQVFFLYNRVKSIDAMAGLIHRIVPEVRVAVAHGQMAEHELERVMLRFLDKKSDVLVCTTIIENGLDIPNVNTIIIHRADRFGLAELYQLRGRVGRTNIHAFAYLLVPPLQRMNSIALKRLQTIEEFTDLGAGYQVALRDLEIRGAGNLLGAEQSGFIAALGFELYCKILDEAVQELYGTDKTKQHETLVDISDVQVEVNADVYIPAYYIERGDMRLDYYRRLVDLRKLEEIEAIRDELHDRFGRLPEEVKNLMNVLTYKILGARLGINKISINDNLLMADFVPEIYEIQRENFHKWVLAMVSKATARFEFIQRDGLKMRVNLKEVDDKLDFAKNFLQSLL
ncbi:transcription-repair coupling factor [candidate division KSB1 bacterium]|nr:transcription-repair coupling factor [candidate division KSB1 bacterium]